MADPILSCPPSNFGLVEASIWEFVLLFCFATTTIKDTLKTNCYGNLGERIPGSTPTKRQES